MRVPRRTSDRTIRPGTVIGRYRVEQVVSSRPNGITVIDARAPNGWRVTLTVLGEDDSREEIVKLAAVRASLEHPHLLPALAPFHDAHGMVLAIAWNGPLTLADRLVDGPLEPQRAVRILAQVAAALELAAGKGLVHRDLTPEAVALRERGPDHAFLGDFGIALPPARGCGLAGEPAGVEYRSPEELRGERPRPRSNVYSLACILVECLTGAPPYWHARPLLTIHSHLVDPPPRISERRDGLSPRIDDVIARALAKNPQERFRSPAELVEASGRALGADVRVPVATDLARQRRRERTATRERRRRSRQVAPVPSRRSRRAVAVTAGALLVSATAGFATGSADWSGNAPNGAAPHARPSQSTQEESRYIVSVDRVLTRLSARRAVLRHRLGRAPKASGQAAAAARLGAAYASAHKALPPAPEQFAQPRLGARLAVAERGYRRLAVAARTENRQAWNRARGEAARADARVNRALRALKRATSA
jgi:serine/threonine-protein kinase